ncbi:MAG: 4-hydroxythreonine-4-phosphate dehydrogenase PdxA [Pseudomonadota bacterium]
MPSLNTNSSQTAAPIAITLGDPAGVGPEIVAKAWHARKAEKLTPFFWIGDPGLLRDCPTQSIAAPDHALEVWQNALPVLPLEMNGPVTPGAPSAHTAPAVIEALEISAALSQAAKASAVVTAPMAKDLLYAAGFNAPGQTEFYADACAVERDRVVMMLAAPMLKVVPITIHIPLAKVPEHLTQDLIIARAITTDAALRQDFGIGAPRLALCGLNPHAGEHGKIGDEEEKIIAPAVDALRAQGIDARGPFSADTMFHAEARAGYDAALAMYHDQGLIPLKALDFHSGVNVTLGLPIVRTSPDHGTAFDIAGKNLANPRSMIEAIRVAGAIAARRSAA